MEAKKSPEAAVMTADDARSRIGSLSSVELAFVVQRAFDSPENTRNFRLYWWNLTEQEEAELNKRADLAELATALTANDGVLRLLPDLHSIIAAHTEAVLKAGEHREDLDLTNVTLCVDGAIQLSVRIDPARLSIWENNFALLGLHEPGGLDTTVFMGNIESHAEIGDTVLHKSVLCLHGSKFFSLSDPRASAGFGKAPGEAGATLSLATGAALVPTRTLLHYLAKLFGLIVQGGFERERQIRAGEPISKSRVDALDVGVSLRDDPLLSFLDKSGGDRRPQAIQTLWNEDGLRNFSQKVSDLQQGWNWISSNFDPKFDSRETFPTDIRERTQFNSHFRGCQKITDEILFRVGDSELRPADREPVALACYHAFFEIGYSDVYDRAGCKHPSTGTLKNLYYQGLKLL